MTLGTAGVGEKTRSASQRSAHPNQAPSVGAVARNVVFDPSEWRPYPNPGGDSLPKTMAPTLSSTLCSSLASPPRCSIRLSSPPPTIDLRM